MATSPDFSIKDRTGRDCSQCSVRAHCLASSMENEDLDTFASSRLDLNIFRKGQHLYHAGESFKALYIVRSGAVKTTVVSKDGMEQVTGFYLPGEIVGLDAIEADQYGSSAIALETSSVCLYSFERLMRLAQDSAGLQRQLWQLASREIATRQRMLMTMGHRSAEARLAEFLLSLSIRFKRIGYSPTQFHLPMSRQDIADYLGQSVETVCRVLTRFQKAGTIERAQREIRLINVEALMALSVGSIELRVPKNRPDTRRSNWNGRAGEYAAAAG